MQSGRSVTNNARLARLGFSDLDRATRLLESPALFGMRTESAITDLANQGDEVGDFAAQVATAADPDQALLLVTRFLEACSDQQRRRVSSALLADTDAMGRLLEVLGMSEALGSS